MSGGQSDISVSEICAMLNARVAEFAPDLIPGGRPDARRRFHEAGSVDGEPGQSFKLNLTGANQGRYTDFSAAPGTWQYSGDVLTLLRHLRFGGDIGKAVAYAKSYLGLDDMNPERVAQVKRDAADRVEKQAKQAEADVEKNRRRAYALWRGAVPIKGTPAQAYLEGRGIDFAKLGRFPGSLRYCPDVWCAVRGAKHPAMIACIMNLAGDLVGVHRTYLDLSEGKGGAVRVVKVASGNGKLKSHKSSMGPYQGGCIPLHKGECGKTLRDIDPGTAVFASEGIEDGLSVALAAPDKRVVAGVALANLGGLELPPQAGPLVFIAQNDTPGSKAVESFERAIARQQEKRGKDAAKLMFPKPEYKDFNDQLLNKPMVRA